MNVAITLEVSHDDELEDALREMLDGYDEIGCDLAPGVSAAGWPLVRFFGPMKEMVRFLDVYCNYEHDETLAMCESLEVVL